METNKQHPEYQYLNLMQEWLDKGVEQVDAGTGVNKVRVGQRIKIHTKKNKTAPAYQTAYVDYYFKDSGVFNAGDYDTAKEGAAMSITLGVIERKGGWIYYADRKWQGLEAFANSVREEVDLFEELRVKVLSNTTTPIGDEEDE